MLIHKDSATQNLVFLMVDAADHITGKTGLSPTVTLSKNGAAFAAPAGSVTETGNGWYMVAAHATDANTLGPLALHATASGADPVDMLYHVVACNPQDAAGLGLSRLDAAISTRSTYAGADTAGTTTLLSRIPDTLSLTAINAQADAALTDYDAPTKAELDAAFTQIKGAGWSDATDTLEEIAAIAGSGGGSSPSAADIALEVWAAEVRTLSAFAFITTADLSAAVWDEALADHTTAGTSGRAMADIADIKTIVQSGEES